MQVTYPNTPFILNPLNNQAAKEAKDSLLLKVAQAAFKVLLTLTLAIPAGLGIYEYFRHRVKNLHDHEPSLLERVLKAILIFPLFLAGINELWKDRWTAQTERMNPSDLQGKSLSNFSRIEQTRLLSRKEIVRELTKEQLLSVLQSPGIDQKLILFFLLGEGEKKSKGLTSLLEILNDQHESLPTQQARSLYQQATQTQQGRLQKLGLKSHLFDNQQQNWNKNGNGLTNSAEDKYGGTKTNQPGPPQSPYNLSNVTQNKHVNAEPANVTQNKHVNAEPAEVSFQKLLENYHDAFAELLVSKRTKKSFSAYQNAQKEFASKQTLLVEHINTANHFLAEDFILLTKEEQHKLDFDHFFHYPRKNSTQQFNHLFSFLKQLLLIKNALEGSGDWSNTELTNSFTQQQVSYLYDVCTKLWRISLINPYSFTKEEFVSLFNHLGNTAIQNKQNEETALREQDAKKKEELRKREKEARKLQEEADQKRAEEFENWAKKFYESFSNKSNQSSSSCGSQSRIKTVADAYKALGLKNGTPFQEVRTKAFLLFKEHHPDKNSSPDAAEKFGNCYDAYTMLKNHLEPKKHLKEK